ncbi:hypothetical protein CLV44_13024 [Marinobacterium halophilum]|uniref:Uncharacterized protein n=1 Tax=Marinobacterium halophilum TaxID=267374 RepID=A0A2P8EJL2_9GAMM|nr:hypothetical protein CLV44_13024 [Marinobacterium halophilum]
MKSKERRQCLMSDFEVLQGFGVENFCDHPLKSDLYDFLPGSRTTAEMHSTQLAYIAVKLPL